MPQLNLAQWKIFADQYYWRTALLIARSALSKQYRNSFLGILWTLVQPMSMVVIYALIIPMIAHFSTDEYPLYIISTLPLWGFMSSALMAANWSLLSQAETLKRCMISTTLFPIADVMRLTYTYFVSFAVMYLLTLVLGYEFSWYALLWPIYFIPVMLTIMSVSVGIAYAAPYVRDIGDAIFVSMNMLMWASAVIYPIDALPVWVANVLEWNPFYILMQPVIELVYHHRLPSLFITCKLFGVMGLSVIFGYTLYRICRRNFVYYL